MHLEDFWYDIACYSIVFTIKNREFHRFITVPMGTTEETIRNYLENSFKELGETIEILDVLEAEYAWYPREIPLGLCRESK